MIDLLQGTANRSPDAPFVLHEEQTYTFRQVHDIALQGAAWLEARGISPGDRVVIAVSNRPLFLFYWFSLLVRGAIAVPVSHDLFGHNLDYIVQQSGAKGILTETVESARMASALPEFDGAVIGFDDEAEFIDAASRHAPLVPHPAAPSTTAAILYTSGTTGQPKGVVIPIASYLAAGEKIVEAIGIDAADRILTFLPLHHANPQMYAVMSALTAGCSMILVARFSASGLLSQAREYGATGFTYVGTVLSILSRTIDGPRDTSLKWCVGGGAPEPVWKDLAVKLDLRIHELYGMTETGGVSTINSRQHYRVGSVGHPRDDFEVVLLDDDDRVVTQGVGEIAVRPKQPWLMTSGYHDKPEETMAALTNLWFHTGDFGRFDADGYLYFEGRKKELIRRAGEMISPLSIELVACHHPAIADCAVVGIPDDVLGEEIKLVIVERAPVDHTDLLGFLKARLPRHEVPRYLDFIDRIPKTPTEKIQRFKLKTASPRLVDLAGPKT